MIKTSTDCIQIFIITQTIAEDTPPQTTRQRNINNHCVVDKIFIFHSAVVVLKNEFFYRHYLILDTLSHILAGPDSSLLGDILVNVKLWGTQLLHRALRFKIPW